MIKRSPEQWQALFDAHKESDLSAAAFCREHKLCPKYFSLRRKQLRQSQPVSKSAEPAFVQAKVSVANIQIELSFKESRLRLPSGVSPVWLADLLKALV